NADWYVGNCHKWLCAPKGCAFLWARPDRQDDLHPVVISHGFGKGFLAEFDWTGTWDPSAFLAVTAAIDFHNRLGGAKLRQHNIEPARAGPAHLVQRLGTEPGAAPELFGSMGLIRLPLAGASTPERGLALRDRLLDAATDAPLHHHDGTIWLRISAQAYNEMADYEKLGDIVMRVVKQNA